MTQRFKLNPFTGRLDIADEDVGPAGDVEFLEGDAGGSVPPDAGKVVYLTSGGGMTITGNPGTNTLTFTAASGGYTWTRVAGAAQALVSDNAYIATNAGLTTFTLPATAAVGDHFQTVGEGAGGITIAQNPGQSIRLGNTVTTVGVGGSVSSTNQYDSMEFVCTVANTEFRIVDSVGVLNLV